MAKLVEALVEFARGRGVVVVAEGVETADEAAALRALGVDYGQGWHYGRPGPPEALSVATPTPGLLAPRQPSAGALTR